MGIFYYFNIASLFILIKMCVYNKRFCKSQYLVLILGKSHIKESQYHLFVDFISRYLIDFKRFVYNFH